MVRRARRVPPVAERVRDGATVVVVAKATRLERAVGARPAVAVARRRRRRRAPSRIVSAQPRGGLMQRLAAMRRGRRARQCLWCGVHGIVDRCSWSIGSRRAAA